MSRAWRLTPRAEDALVDIATWTIARFGAPRADAYERELIDVCRAIARGTAHSQDCSMLVAGPAGAAVMRFARAGRHFVIFTEIRDEVVILDFIHGRADLPRRIRALGDRLP